MLIKILYYCPESDFYYDDHETVKEMVEKWTRKQVLKQVKQLIQRKTNMQVDKPMEMGSAQEASLNVDVVDKPIESAAETAGAGESGSNAEHVQDLESDKEEPKSLAEADQNQDEEEEDKQSAMLEVAENLHSQLTRLKVAPSVKDWNSIARFLQKSNILDRVDKASEVSNQRAHEN